MASRNSEESLEYTTKPRSNQSEDPLSIGDHDDPHPAFGPVLENPAYPTPVLRRHIQPAGPAEDRSELPARLPDGRGVDHRHHGLEVPHQGAIEEGLVPVLQAGQVDVLIQRAALAVKIVENPLLLLRRREHPGRQQSPEAECVTLRFGKGGALVAAGIVQQIFRAAVATLQKALQGWE